MKKLLSLILLVFFVVGCSEEAKFDKEIKEIIKNVISSTEVTEYEIEKNNSYADIVYLAELRDDNGSCFADFWFDDEKNITKLAVSIDVADANEKCAYYTGQMFRNDLVLDNKEIALKIADDATNMDEKDSYEEGDKIIYLSNYYDNKKYLFEINSEEIIFEKMNEEKILKREEEKQKNIELQKQKEKEEKERKIEEEKLEKKRKAEEEKLEKERKKQEEIDNASFGEQQALEKAIDYIDYSAFSKEGLYDQLKFEGFSNKEARFAVNHIDASWKKQALLKGQDYLNYSSFSKQGLYDQLIFEKFTKKQARYATNKLYK